MRQTKNGKYWASQKYLIKHLLFNILHITHYIYLSCKGKKRRARDFRASERARERRKFFNFIKENLYPFHRTAHYSVLLWRLCFFFVCSSLTQEIQNLQQLFGFDLHSERQKAKQQPKKLKDSTPYATQSRMGREIYRKKIRSFG